MNLSVHTVYYTERKKRLFYIQTTSRGLFWSQPEVVCVVDRNFDFNRNVCCCMSFFKRTKFRKFISYFLYTFENVDAQPSPDWMVIKSNFQKLLFYLSGTLDLKR